METKQQANLLFVDVRAVASLEMFARIACEVLRYLLFPSDMYFTISFNLEHTHPHKFTPTHHPNFNLFLSHFKYKVSLSLSFSLQFTQTLQLCLHFTHKVSLSLSLVLSSIHTHTFSVSLVYFTLTKSHIKIRIIIRKRMQY